VALPEFGIRLTQPVFRAHNPEWAWAPDSGAGAERHGGRFNPIGMPALYTSMRELTAIREASPLGQPMQPLTLCQYQVDCDCLFDSRDEHAMKKEKLSPATLACPTWRRDMMLGDVPDSHTAALLLIQQGYRGMIVHSFANGATDDDINVVFWDWSDTRPNQVTVVDEYDRLPVNRDSWT